MGCCSVEGNAPEGTFAGIGNEAANGDPEPDTIVAGGSSSATLVCGDDPPPNETGAETPVFAVTVAIGAGPLGVALGVALGALPVLRLGPWPIPLIAS